MLFSCIETASQPGGIATSLASSKCTHRRVLWKFAFHLRINELAVTRPEDDGSEKNVASLWNRPRQPRDPQNEEVMPHSKCKIILSKHTKWPPYRRNRLRIQWIQIINISKRTSGFKILRLPFYQRQTKYRQHCVGHTILTYIIKSIITPAIQFPWGEPSICSWCENGHWY